MTKTELIEYSVAPDTASKANKQCFPHGKVLIVVDEHGFILNIENRNESLFGYSHKRLINQPFANLIASSDQALYLDAFLGTNTHSCGIMLTFYHADGYFFPARIEAKPIDPSNTLKAQSFRQLWQKQSDDQEFREQSEIRAHFGTWQLNPVTLELKLSRGIYKLLAIDGNPNLTVEQLLYYFGAQQSRVKAKLRRCFNSQTSISLDTHLLNKNRQRHWLRLYAEAEIYDGKTISLRGSVEDISYHKNLQFKVGYFDACVSCLMEQSDDLILILDKKGRIIAFNKAYQKAFKQLFDKDLKKGDLLDELLSGFRLEQRIYQKLRGLILFREQITMEMPLAQRDERLPVYQINLRQLKNKEGQRLGISFVAKLNLPSNKGKFTSNFLARHDPLTGLLNLNEFQHLLSQCCQNTRKCDSKHILIYLDLCNFSALNKRLGAEAGDHILKQCSQVMKNKLRERDTLARLGADEFGIILEHCDSDQAIVITHQLRDSIRASIFEWQDKRYTLDLQAGIVPITKESDNAVSLLRLAKQTCLAASGNNPPIRRYHFTKQRQSHTDSRRYIDIIKDAFSHEENFILDFQPIQPINEDFEGQFVELLTRIKTLNNEIILPGQFINTARRFDFMQDIDKKVLVNASNWLAQHIKSRHQGLVCSVNISLESIQNNDFIPFIQALISKHEIWPDNLCLEISEAYCLDHFEIVKSTCSALKSAGFKVLIDHTGSTQLDARYLLDLDIDMVKLDGSLTQNLTKHPVQVLAIEYIAKIAALNGLKTIASQLESEESVLEVTRLGIHYGQGYGLARPKALARLRVA